MGDLLPYVNRMKDQRTRNRVRQLKVEEVSLVDNPANASARFVLTKRDDIQKDDEDFDDLDALEAEIDELEDEIAAEADFEVTDEEDAEYGDDLDDDDSDEEDEEEDSEDEDSDDAESEDEEIANEANAILAKAYTTFESASSRTQIWPMIDALRESLSSIVNDTDSDAVEKRNAIKKSIGQFAKAADRLIGEDANTVTKLLDEDSMKTQVAKSGATSLEKRMEQLHDRNEALQKRLDDRDHADRVAQARVTLGKSAPKEDVETLAVLLKNDPAQAELVTRLAKRAQAAEEAGFGELGTSEGGDVSNPEEMVNKKAEELRKSNPALTRAQSIAKAYEDLGDDAYLG